MEYLSPRDISTVRYMQHHQWMEETFHSPYSTGQIVPGELGLVCKGKIEEDFFQWNQTPKVRRPGARRAEDLTHSRCGNEWN